MVRLTTSMLLLLVLALVDLSSLALAKESAASAEEKITKTAEAAEEDEKEATTTAKEEKEEATTTVMEEKEEATTTAEEEKEEATTTEDEEAATTEAEKEEATTTVDSEEEAATTTEAEKEESTSAEVEKEEATTTALEESEETTTAAVAKEDEDSTSPDTASQESTTAKEKQESSHGGAYTAEVVEDIAARMQKGKIRANWVVEKGEKLQICGIDDETECMQTQVTDVEKIGDDDGEDEFRIKFWPPSANLIKKSSPINKAGTDATPTSPGWKNENCSILDISLDGKYYASPQKTRSCRSLLTAPEKLFEKIKLPGMTGHGALVMSLVGSMAMIAGVVSLIVASRRAVNGWRQGVGYEVVCTPREPGTREIAWADIEADTNNLE